MKPCYIINIFYIRSYCFYSRDIYVLISKIQIWMLTGWSVHKLFWKHFNCPSEALWGWLGRFLFQRTVHRSIHVRLPHVAFLCLTKCIKIPKTATCLGCGFPTSPPIPVRPWATCSPTRQQGHRWSLFSCSFPQGGGILWAPGSLRPAAAEAMPRVDTHPAVAEWLAVSGKGVLLIHAAVQHSERSLFPARPFEPERKWSLSLCKCAADQSAAAQSMLVRHGCAQRRNLQNNCSWKYSDYRHISFFSQEWFCCSNKRPLYTSPTLGRVWCVWQELRDW